ncbi:MAG: lytic murein transglycosylase [Candidatus Lambdaproteobacteria bacterium]|nr:lytic murein transglycosylase [Candidatus Lambdaproteobacteria bacterium]
MTSMLQQAKRAVLTLLAAVLLSAPGLPGAAAGSEPHFTPLELEPLLKKLEGDGFDREALNRTFYDPLLQKIPRVISLNTLTDETHRLYEEFLTPYAIRQARRYRERHLGLLKEAERKYGVSRDVIVAVLLVETQFGTFPLKYRVLEVFTTLAVDGQPQSAYRYFDELKPGLPHLELEYLQSRLLQKAGWAYDELVALLQIEIPGKRPYDLLGSYAGAFGIAQFLPSSYRRWAVDGNGDGRVDLDDHADAIASTANYLRAHGWNSQAGLALKMSAVWKYNNSRPYVDTIFEISRLINRPAYKRTQRTLKPPQASVREMQTQHAQAE